ncbi:collagen alpha-1(I) chain-like [Cynocephalus volans]|uniref:collagen alpha-1(I) chain-like n=1 Tax=Cynocephalus volans TaxID=110931 RepID=UPI002FC808CD
MIPAGLRRCGTAEPGLGGRCGRSGAPSPSEERRRQLGRPLWPQDAAARPAVPPLDRRGRRLGGRGGGERLRPGSGGCEWVQGWPGSAAPFPSPPPPRRSLSQRPPMPPGAAAPGRESVAAAGAPAASAPRPAPAWAAPRPAPGRAPPARAARGGRRGLGRRAGVLGGGLCKACFIVLQPERAAAAAAAAAAGGGPRGEGCAGRAGGGRGRGRGFGGGARRSDGSGARPREPAASSACGRAQPLAFKAQERGEGERGEGTEAGGNGCAGPVRAGVSWEGSRGCLGLGVRGGPPRCSGSGCPAAGGIAARVGRGGTGLGPRAPHSGAFGEVREAGSGRLGPACLAGGLEARDLRRRVGEAGDEGASAEAAKAQCGRAACALCRSVSCHSVTRADPVPAGGASPPPPLSRGADAERSGVTASRLWRGSGTAMPLLQTSVSLEVFRPSARLQLPPGGSATRRTTLPAAARPECAAAMTSGPAANGWARGPRPHNAARGRICPQLRPGAAIVPSSAPARSFGSPCCKRAPTRPAVVGDQGRRVGPGEGRGAAEPAARTKRGRALVAPRGDLVRGGAPGSARAQPGGGGLAG